MSGYNNESSYSVIPILYNREKLYNNYSKEMGKFNCKEDSIDCKFSLKNESYTIQHPFFNVTGT